MSNKPGKRKQNEIAQQQRAEAGQGSALTSFTAQRTEIRRAPIPTAAELREYRDLDPDLYEIIKREFEANGPHRRKIEESEAADRKTLIAAVTRNDTLGLVLSWVFAVGCLVTGIYFIVKGIPMAGFIALIGLLPSIITAIRLTVIRARQD